MIVAICVYLLMEGELSKLQSAETMTTGLKKVLLSLFDSEKSHFKLETLWHYDLEVFWANNK